MTVELDGKVRGVSDDGPSAEGPVHPRDRLARALGELETLAAELAQADVRLKAQGEAARASLAERFERECWELGERHRKQREHTGKEHEKAVAALRQRLLDTEQQIKETAQASVRSAREQAEDQVRQTKKAIQDGEWLADSILEGAEAAARKNAQVERESHEKSHKSLDDKQARAIELLAEFGQQHLILEPAPPAAVVPDDVDEKHARSALTATSERLDKAIDALGSVELARMFVGITPYFAGAAMIGAGLLLGQATTLSLQFDPVRAAIGGAVGAVGVTVAAVALRALANRRVRAALLPVRQALEDARAWTDAVHALSIERIDVDLKAARNRRESDIRVVRDRHNPQLEKAQATVKFATVQAEATAGAALASARKHCEDEVAFADVDLARRLADLDARLEADKLAARQRLDRQQAEGASQFTRSLEELKARWQTALQRISQADEMRAMLGDTGRLDWQSADFSRWTPPGVFPPAVRFGELRVDVAKIADAALAEAGLSRSTASADVSENGLAAAGARRWSLGELPEEFSVPAVLAFGLGAKPAASSLLIDFDRSSRDAALSALRGTTARLLASMPPGRVRLTFIDPTGLGQTFAGFMHLADYDEQLTGPRIWTDGEAIDKRLGDLADHMETVIQKYLRNEFDNINAYNEQAGELAEPYRFLVVADFPVGWSTEAQKKLTSILSAGARCGVHVLMARDSRVQVERRLMEDVRAGTSVVSMVPPKGTPATEAAAFPPQWADAVFGKFPLTLDGEPGDAALTALCRAVGEGARKANRVQVDFRCTLPAESERWTGSTAGEFKVPLGRSGATRLQHLKLGKGVSQHGLIAGKTGSGKSTLLHVMVTAGAMWYTPDEVEFYLIDFKKGVEFKAYVDGRLPHCKAVAVESDREFGVSVLQRIDAELSRRGELFRQVGVQDLSGYRATPNAVPLPRTLLVIDEFQEFFSEDDKLAQEASGLLDRLVRQGRAFGMHALLGSQTIGGSAGLPRATLGQMAVRVALQCSEADSTMILGDANTAARLLTRPGEAIYNDSGGLPEANSPFQVAWLPDEQRDRLLADVSTEAQRRGWRFDAVVFEGNKPVDPETHIGLISHLTAPPATPQAILGEPVAIKPATRVLFRRQPGSNMLLIGQQEEAAMATLQAALACLARPGSKLIVLEGTAADSPLRGCLSALPKLMGRFAPPPADMLETVDYRDVDAAIGRVYDQLQSRLADPDAGVSAGPIFVVIYALQRYRSLRKSGDDYSSFSMSDEPKKLSPDKQLAEIIREGPAVGIHILAWADTLVAVERVVERGLMREFDHRVLFQMSASDSSALIDSPAANRLGPHRALLFSEEQGILEKFRPFSLLKV